MVVLVLVCGLIVLFCCWVNLLFGFVSLRLLCGFWCSGYLVGFGLYRFWLVSCSGCLFMLLSLSVALFVFDSLWFHCCVCGCLVA